MKSYPVKIPFWIKSIFNKWTWSVKTNKKEVFLTFDDGPIPEITPWVLQELDNYNAKATFFCIGENIKKHPEVFKQVIEQKHQIGNHTFNHLMGWKNNTDTYINNTLVAEEYLKPKRLKLFRPPYGKINLKQSKELRKLGYKIIMWDVLSGDFDTKLSPEDCIKNVLSSVKNGSIIVFHDSLKAADRLKIALPIILKTLEQKGFQFSSIDNKTTL